MFREGDKDTFLCIVICAVGSFVYFISIIDFFWIVYTGPLLKKFHAELGQPV